MDDAVANLIALVVLAIVAGLVRLVKYLLENSDSKRKAEAEAPSHHPEEAVRPAKTESLESFLEALAKAASGQATEAVEVSEPPPIHEPQVEMFEVESTLAPDEFEAPISEVPKEVAQQIEPAAALAETREESVRSELLVPLAFEGGVEEAAPKSGIRLRREDLRDKMVWTFVLGRPRALVPYGVEEPWALPRA